MTDPQSEQNNQYVIVRTVHAGAFAGYNLSTESIYGDCGNLLVHLGQARRLWYWSGAATLSEMAVSGTSQPDSCRFPVPVSEVILPGVVEILFCTQAARDSITAVPVWTAHDASDAGTTVPAPPAQAWAAA